jgi:hypothetical protein
MHHRLLISALASLCIVLCASTAHAQIGSSCLRPLGIPDKWIEMQTPPWDPTDTFDPTGTNPDIYQAGFDPVADQGLRMSLVPYNRLDPLRGQSAWPIVVSEPGGTAFMEAIVACSGYLHGVGVTFPTMTGNPLGPFGAGMSELIAQDPNAAWDPAANGGRGGVINSAFAQSPRVIALPVFAPDTYAGAAREMSPAMVKIVGFFVAERTTGAVHGYLTGWSQLAAAPVTGRIGDSVPLSATFTGPGSPIVGLPVEFLYNDMVVATAETDGTGTARTATMGFQIGEQPGQYPGAIRARLRESTSFFVADEAAADLTVMKKLPVITWLPPADITYGTPLGALQLNAVADVPGEFTYAPAAGTILTPDEHAPAPLAVTFVPADADMFDRANAESYVTVHPAPLTVSVNDATKLYLDPLPAFSFSAVGFVNGEGPSVLMNTSSLGTSASAASDVGTYRIAFEWIAATNYAITLTHGVLTVVPRPTVAVLQSSTASPTTYGQAVSFNVAVSSGAGVPGGNVTLLSGGVPVAAAALVDGQATLSLGSLDAGTHMLSAEYSGGGGFSASSSPGVTHTVNAATTMTELTSSQNPSRTGDAVTFTAVVHSVAPGAGAPAGSVAFLRNGVVIGSGALASGSARLTVATLPAGKHTIQARYLGTGNHQPSASAVMQQAVKGGGK